KAEHLDEVALATTAAGALEGRRGGRALFDPTRLDGQLLAERTDVDELGALRRSEADGALAHQQRPLADRAGLRGSDFRDPHPASECSPRCANPSTIANVSYMCLLHVDAR